MNLGQSVGRASLLGLGFILLAFTLLPPKYASAASGDKVATAPTGTISVVGPDDTYNWAAVNEPAMWVDLALAADDVDFFYGVGLVGGNYVDAKWAGGSKGYCDPTIHASATRWYATGTGLTTISATLRDLSNNPETNDADPTITLVDTVGGFRLDSITVRELSGTSTLTTNSLTVTGMTTTSLYMSPCNTRFQLIAATTPSTGPFRANVRYVIDESGAAPASGNFVSTPQTITRGGGQQAIVNVGYDLDRNAILSSAPPSEYRMSLRATTISFTSSHVDSRRTAPAALAESLFPVKATEHYEIGNPFNFQLLGGLTGAASLIRYEVWDTDGVNDLITSGKAVSFSCTFATGVAEGDVFVRFYADCDDDGVHDSGEPYVDSPEFWVQQLRTISFTLRKNANITATQTTFQAAATASAALALRKDTTDDWRACIHIDLGNTVLLFVPDATYAEPVANTTQLNIHFAAPRTFTVVELMTFARGAADAIPGSEIVLSWSTYYPRTIVHEVGHVIGLYHIDQVDPTFTDTMNIMFSGPNGNPNANKLLQNQADTYD